jgi:hypothetical protein
MKCKNCANKEDKLNIKRITQENKGSENKIWTFSSKENNKEDKERMRETRRKGEEREVKKEKEFMNSKIPWKIGSEEHIKGIR